MRTKEIQNFLFYLYHFYRAVNLSGTKVGTG